jgi:hypothetical protein
MTKNKVYEGVTSSRFIGINAMEIKIESKYFRVLSSEINSSTFDF